MVILFYLSANYQLLQSKLENKKWHRLCFFYVKKSKPPLFLDGDHVLPQVRDVDEWKDR